MFATAIMGRIVGVKYASRTKPRPRSLRFTQIAMSSASAMEVGMVPSANTALLCSTCQNTGSSNIAR
jgi:hypothetical protein